MLLGVDDLPGMSHAGTSMSGHKSGAAEIPKPLAPGEDRSLQGLGSQKLGLGFRAEGLGFRA